MEPGDLYSFPGSVSRAEAVRLSTLETLCRHFGVMSIAELIEYRPEEVAA
jgi:DNA-binding Xre family transcriptional regulator